MEATHGSISAQLPWWRRQGRAAATWITLIAALWGFAAGRATAPAARAVARSDAVFQREPGLADMPLLIPSGEPGRVWGHWDSAPIRLQRDSTLGAATPLRARQHHRVKWG